MEVVGFDRLSLVLLQALGVVHKLCVGGFGSGAKQAGRQGVSRIILFQRRGKYLALGLHKALLVLDRGQ